MAAFVSTPCHLQILDNFRHQVHDFWSLQFAWLGCNMCHLRVLWFQQQSVHIIVACLGHLGINILLSPLLGIRYLPILRISYLCGSLRLPVVLLSSLWICWSLASEVLVCCWYSDLRCRNFLIWFKRSSRNTWLIVSRSKTSFSNSSRCSSYASFSSSNCISAWLDLRDKLATMHFNQSSCNYAFQSVFSVIGLTASRRPCGSYWTSEKIQIFPYGLLRADD